MKNSGRSTSAGRDDVFFQWPFIYIWQARCPDGTDSCKPSGFLTIIRHGAVGIDLVSEKILIERRHAYSSNRPITPIWIYSDSRSTSTCDVIGDERIPSNPKHPLKTWAAREPPLRNPPLSQSQQTLAHRSGALPIRPRTAFPRICRIPAFSEIRYLARDAGKR